MTKAMTRSQHRRWHCRRFGGNVGGPRAVKIYMLNWQIHARATGSLLAVLCAAVYFWLPSPAAAQQDPVISVDVEVVNILATVRDKKGKLITHLKKEDFRLEDEGKLQEIKYFSRQTDLPLTVGLLVDTSLSQERLIYDERRAGAQFFSQVLRHKKDLAFLIGFDVDVELLQDLTESRTLLRSGLEKLEIQGAGRGIHPGPVPTSGRPTWTALFDAVYLASSEMMRNQVGRKALILISDGVDVGSKVKQEEAIEAAQRADIVLYGIRYYDRRAYYGRGGFSVGGGGGSLKRLAKETGGSVFEVSRKRPLEKVFDAIQEELRSQYSLGYSPSDSNGKPGPRKIKLRTKQRSLKVQSRKEYYPHSP